ALALAQLYDATRRPDDALATLQAAAAQGPRAAELWLAQANLLARRGHLGQALDVLERGSAPNAAGPQAGLAITRAQILLLKGQVHEARKALSAALEKVPAGQKPLLWKALGDFYTAQGELTDARAAFEQWARLEPDNPEPRVSLFQLAAAADDDAAVA